MLHVSLCILRGSEVRLGHAGGSHNYAELSLLGMPSVLQAASLTEADAVSNLRKLYLSYKLSFFEGAREMTSSIIQSALAFLCVGVRSAEESPRPFAYIFAYRNGPTQIVNCWVGSHAYE